MGPVKLFGMAERGSSGVMDARHSGTEESPACYDHLHFASSSMHLHSQQVARQENHVCHKGNALPLCEVMRYHYAKTTF